MKVLVDDGVLFDRGGCGGARATSCASCFLKVDARGVVAEVAASVAALASPGLSLSLSLSRSLAIYLSLRLYIFIFIYIYIYIPPSLSLSLSRTHPRPAAPFPTGSVCVCYAALCTMQGCLAHKKTHPPMALL